jgi:cytochrome c biogenesis factor
MLAFVVLALVLAIDRDLNVATARLLLPAYPAVIAAATVGWWTRRSRWATFALTIPVVAFGAWFAVFELLARFSPRLG